MLTVRSRDDFKYFLLKHALRDQILSWKKGQISFPGEVYEMAVALLLRYFSRFDVVTVPAPSFHIYENGGYPIWELAGRLAKDCGFDLQCLFPERSGKTKKHFTGWRDKVVQDVAIGPGLFVLILDDIATTGMTIKITYQAILNKGSYPCGVVMA
jgi:predicted amidophosphoribosyltransferase